MMEFFICFRKYLHDSDRISASRKALKFSVEILQAKINGGINLYYNDIVFTIYFVLIFIPHDVYHLHLHALGHTLEKF